VGLFITLEGGEGAGKSTQSRLLQARLKQAICTREPGGTPRAEKLREFILSGQAKAWGSEAEAVLFAAARLDHVTRVISPALLRGAHVICDRFIDSTLVYQGLTGKTDLSLLANLQSAAIGACLPDMTFIIDVPVALGLARAKARHVGVDRFEAEDFAFHAQLRAGFLRVAQENASRCVVIDGAQPQEVVAAEIWSELTACFDV
jgi:dTMP kinase